MRLPHRDRVEVAREKLTDYLLDSGHPDNGGKAAFFARMGYSRDNWFACAEALKALARSKDVAAMLESPHGEKYIVDGTLAAASGAERHLRTIWIVDADSTIPRLVTAYPLGE